MSKKRREIVKTVTRELEEMGAEVLETKRHGRGHWRTNFKVDGVETFVTYGSHMGDPRAHKNVLSDVRRKVMTIWEETDGTGSNS